MNLKSASPRVPLIAVSIVANEWFFTGMGQLMGLQVALSDELLLALVADEWSFASVSPHMGLEISSFRKFL